VKPTIDSRSARSQPTKPALRTAGQRRSIYNVPNTLCAIRLLGSFGLVYLALTGQTTVFLWVFVCLVVTDWIDGKLAILLRQQTEFGARLDSAADATLYSALLFGICWLKWDFVVQQSSWIIGVAISYALTSVAGLLKFRRLPSYHTWAAKTSWHLLNVAVICLFAEWAVWPFHVAMAAVILTNLEATAITLSLPRWQADVRSLYHATIKSTAR
jgi:cardiolipin synthase